MVDFISAFGVRLQAAFVDPQRLVEVTFQDGSRSSIWVGKIEGVDSPLPSSGLYAGKFIAVVGFDTESGDAGKAMISCVDVLSVRYSSKDLEGSKAISQSRFDITGTFAA